MTADKRKTTSQKIHFIGIGGIGISALARWFLAQGWTVSGSDLSENATTKELQAEGARIKIGHNKSNLPARLDMVVYSNAITDGSPGYPELEEARKRNLRPMSYPQTLGCLTEVYKTISIAGSHGKSTTTALIGLVLKDSSIDPTIVVGTKLRELGGKNFRLGKTNWLVLESDEWRGAFLHYHPDIVVITNIDREHLDFYRDLNDVKKNFLSFIGRTKPGGCLVLNRDDKNLFSLSSKIDRIAQKNSLTILWYSLKDEKTISKIKKHLFLSGIHNLSNALAAYLVTHAVLKVKEADVLKRLGAYQGAWRRMEYRGELRDKKLSASMQVYDDYAHHPTEIKATLQAFREKFPKSKIICVYQTHQAKRLKALYKEFVGAFEDADTLILLPTYEVAGRDDKKNPLTSKKLSEDLKKKSPKKEIIYLADPKKIKETICTLYQKKLINHPPVVIMMGAGSVVEFTAPLISR